MQEREYEVRDPIHGMIPFSSLEREIINSYAFQGLRRIRQLSWTDYVYPGAMHTRFQHTLGVMHIASRAFDAIFSDKRSRDILNAAYGIRDDIIDRQRIIIRIAALVHDLGHCPFSHAGEELFPEKKPFGATKKNIEGDGVQERYEHEEYSTAIFEHIIYPEISSHKDITSRNISVREILGLINKSPENPLGVLCKDIIAGRMDADRMDYLLRDSYYCGVRYGHYEFDRLLNTICVCEDADDGSPLIGIHEDGLRSVEGLLIARYMMFHNVYMHKTRVVLDFHYRNALRAMLGKAGVFPKPTSPQEIKKYLKWDDWKVQGMLASGDGGEHGEILCRRMHYRLVHQTSESFEDEERKATAFAAFDEIARKADAGQSYVWAENKSFSADIPVSVDVGARVVTRPLLELSGVVKSLRPLNQKRLYVAPSVADSFKSVIGWPNR